MNSSADAVLVAENRKAAEPESSGGTGLQQVDRLLSRRSQGPRHFVPLQIG